MLTIYEISISFHPLKDTSQFHIGQNVGGQVPPRMDAIWLQLQAAQGPRTQILWPEAAAAASM